MTRRAGGPSDPEIRAAIVAKRRYLADAMPTASFRASLAAAESGEPIELPTELLGGALAFYGHPRAGEFTHSADPHRERWWRIDAADVLTEIVRSSP
jgi:hypothetical protein